MSARPEHTSLTALPRSADAEAKLRSFAIISRTKAESAKSARMARAIRSLLAKKGAQAQLYLTSREHNMSSQVRRAQQEHAAAGRGSLCIVICGGDGSIHQGINAVLSEPGWDVTIGLAPGGTCNDFAFALGVKPMPEHIVDVLLSGVAQAVDLGRAGNEYFCTIATLGLESTVNRFLRDNLSRSPPRRLFTAAACAAAVTQVPIKARVTIDARTMDVEILNLLVANTGFYGGHICIAPSANPKDGRIDIVMVQAMSKIRRLLLLPRALKGRHIGHPNVICQRASNITIETDRPREVWADGEPIGHTPLDLKVVPKAIRILVPRSS